MFDSNTGVLNAIQNLIILQKYFIVSAINRSETSDTVLLNAGEISRLSLMKNMIFALILVNIFSFDLFQSQSMFVFSFFLIYNITSITV